MKTIIPTTRCLIILICLVLAALCLSAIHAHGAEPPGATGISVTGAPDLVTQLIESYARQHSWVIAALTIMGSIRVPLKLCFNSLEKSLHASGNSQALAVVKWESGPYFRLASFALDAALSVKLPALLVALSAAPSPPDNGRAPTLFPPAAAPASGAPLTPSPSVSPPGPGGAKS
jgi:hypothetical protein